MLVSGVRSSWLTIERKSSLMRCAACSRAMRSWRSDHSCAFWSAGPGALGHGQRPCAAGDRRPAVPGTPAVASTPSIRPPARIGTARTHPSVELRGCRRGRRCRRRPRSPCARSRWPPRAPRIPSPTRGRRPATNARHAATSGVLAGDAPRHPAGARRRRWSAPSSPPRAAARRAGGDRLAASRRVRATRRSRDPAGSPAPARGDATARVSSSARRCWRRAFSVARPMTSRLNRPAATPMPTR